MCRGLVCVDTSIDDAAEANNGRLLVVSVPPVTGPEDGASQSPVCLLRRVARLAGSLFEWPFDKRRATQWMNWMEPSHLLGCETIAYWTETCTRGNGTVPRP